MAVDLWTPGKTFLYGAAAGGLVTHFVPRYIERAAERMGDNIARKIREGSNPGPNPGLNAGCGDLGTLQLYNRITSTLDKIDKMDSRLVQLETKVYKSG